ncbi:MAG: hypothetical protein HXS41_00060 [Theionarchaea archaeon]|nr:hypothetical protein [Theionarchaea archaeon]
MSFATLLPAAMLFRNQVQNILQYDNLWTCSGREFAGHTLSEGTLVI